MLAVDTEHNHYKGMKVLPFRQHLSVLNNLFGTSKGMNGSFTLALNQGECSTVNAAVLLTKWCFRT